MPLLDSSDAGLADYAGNALGQFEGRAAGRRPDFSLYREIVADASRHGEQPPAGLVRHMYAVHPGEALLTLMRAYQLREPERIQSIVWAEHTVSETLWKQSNGFLDRDDVEPAAIGELARLAGDKQWWARLYVAVVMRKHESLRVDSLIGVLAEDEDALVREAIAEVRNAP